MHASDELRLSGLASQARAGFAQLEALSRAGLEALSAGDRERALLALERRDPEIQRLSAILPLLLEERDRLAGDADARAVVERLLEPLRRCGERLHALDAEVLACLQGERRALAQEIRRTGGGGDAAPVGYHADAPPPGSALDLRS